MSSTLKEAKASVISEINELFNNSNFPKLPIDENPIQGDLSVICFPGARSLNKSAEEVAYDVSLLVSNINFVKSTFIVKAFCNIILDLRKQLFNLGFSKKYRLKSCFLAIILFYNFGILHLGF